jgi:hypothetical protein
LQGSRARRPSSSSLAGMWGLSRPSWPRCTRGAAGNKHMPAAHLLAGGAGEGRILAGAVQGAGAGGAAALGEQLQRDCGRGRKYTCGGCGGRGRPGVQRQASSTRQVQQRSLRPRGPAHRWAWWSGWQPPREPQWRLRAAAAAAAAAARPRRRRCPACGRAAGAWATAAAAAAAQPARCRGQRCWRCRGPSRCTALLPRQTAAGTGCRSCCVRPGSSRTPTAPAGAGRVG